MEPEDAFFKRLQSVDDIARFYEKSERFGTWNSKTLGIILVSITDSYMKGKRNQMQFGPIVKCSTTFLKI